MWTEQQKLLASDRANSEYLGWSVALNGNGNTTIMGAPGKDTLPNINNGAVYVFVV